MRRRVKWHVAAASGAQDYRWFRCYWERYALTLCGRWVPVYLIGNPSDCPQYDCTQCVRKQRKGT